MEEQIKLVISTAILFLSIPIGNLIARWTKEELEQGQKYFKILTSLGLVGGIIGLILKNDAILFSMFFIAIATSRSIRRKKK